MQVLQYPVSNDNPHHRRMGERGESWASVEFFHRQDAVILLVTIQLTHSQDWTLFSRRTCVSVVTTNIAVHMTHHAFPLLQD